MAHIVLRAWALPDEVPAPEPSSGPPTVLADLGLMPRIRPSRYRQPGQPRVAVLIPAHNEAKGIARTLRSLLAQTRVPDFITVVAHNCTDDTAAIARTFPGVEALS
jgi:cellulose synthase/poly-beta-1,6-N-acetylglucosamine synthase-like glycosyltransferase